MNLRWLLCCGMFIAAGGCSSLATDVPDQFDLSGQWELDPARGSGSAQLDRSRDEAGSYRRGRRRPEIGFNPRGLPMLHASGMRIEQNDDSMGIAYDSGAYRDVSWGERALRLADVAAGWDGSELVIETETSGYDMEERYRLAAEGAELELKIHLRPARGDDIKLVRVYRRHRI